MRSSDKLSSHKALPRLYLYYESYDDSLIRVINPLFPDFMSGKTLQSIPKNDSISPRFRIQNFNLPDPLIPLQILCVNRGSVAYQAPMPSLTPPTRRSASGLGC